MMTMDERVEAAARVIRPDWFVYVGPDGESGLANYPGQTARMQESARQVAREALAVAFPELYGDKPGWIAPWEATDGMYKSALEFALIRMEEAGVDGLSPWKDYPPIRGTTEGMFAAMRDAYLGKGDGG